jgi:hypothetical protein
MTVVELRNAQPRYAVRISPEARYTIEEECNRSKFLLADNKETGGLLFGNVDGNLIEVTMATGPGDDFEPEVNTVDLNPYKVLGAEQARAVGDLVLGDWHAHPEGLMVGDHDPSQSDLEHWGQRLLRQSSSAALGLIAIKGVAGWRSPRLFAWVAARREGETVCERIGELHLW